MKTRLVDVKTGDYAGGNNSGETDSPVVNETVYRTGKRQFYAGADERFYCALIFKAH